MTVREFVETDFDAVCRVYLDAKRDELALESSLLLVTPLDRDPAILAAFRESTILVFDRGGVLGFSATFGPQLRALFVHSRARGTGIGGALLRAVCARNGQLAVNVARSNIPARRFYASHGFAVESEFVRGDGCHPIVYERMTWPAPRADAWRRQ